jgi:hypothetical protein
VIAARAGGLLTHRLFLFLLHRVPALESVTLRLAAQPDNSGPQIWAQGMSHAMCLLSKIRLGDRAAPRHTLQTLLDIRASSLAKTALRCRDLVRGVVEGCFAHRPEKLPRYK